MEEMDKDMMRNGLLAELIDQMHGRLADKMFPPDPSKDDQPAATGIPGSEAVVAEDIAEKPDMGEHGDTKGDSVGIPAEDDLSEEDLDEMMKGM